MLDAETKRKIDNCRDILVGKIPDPKSQVEQITIALIYKFMDDMDQLSVYQGGKPSFFTGEFEKYSWSNIFDRRLGGQEILNLYGEALNRMDHNPNIPQLFRDIFKNAFLPYRDPETLRLFLKEISNFTYDHSERLGDAFEYLLSTLSSQGDAGQFITPRHIIAFIVEIIAPQKHETVLDPACGTAGFLISAYKHILRNNPKLSINQKQRLMNNFVGYDISPDMERLSLVNMYLHGFANPKIHEYDTLTSEDRWQDTFDVIMANPPFMSPKGGIRPHSRFSIQAKRSEVLFVDYIAEHLNPGGRAGVIVPEGIIFQSQNAYKALRKMLVENFLWAVVSLPAGVFNPYSGVKTSILLMDKSLAKRIDRILFVKIESDGFDLGAQRRPIDKNDLPAALKFLNIYKSKATNHCERSEAISNPQSEISPFAHTVPKSEIAKSGDYNLTGDRYRTVEHHHQAQWPMVQLGEICEILNGYAFKSENYVNDGVRVIRITNVQQGEIVDDNPKFYPATSQEPIEKYKLFKDDLLVSLTGNVGRVGLLPKDFLPAALNQRVACLRVDKSKISKQFLFRLLNKDSFEQECIKSSSGIAQKNLSTVWLSKYKIPLPPLDIQEKIVAEIDGYQKIIDGARQITENYKPSIKINPTWPIVELESVCDFKRGPFGGSLKKEIFVKSGYKVYEQKHAIQDNFDIGDYYISPDKYEEMKDFALNAGDLIISCSGTMGKIAIVPNQFAPGIINQALLKLTPKLNKVLPLFLKISLESAAIQNDYFQNQLGVAIQNVSSVKVLKQIKISLPSLDEQKRIAEQIESEQKIIYENKKLIKIFEKKISDTIAQIWGE
jgi:type I restriction enzyme M protein